MTTETAGSTPRREAVRASRAPSFVDAQAAARALAEADLTSRRAVERGRNPLWIGIIWSICMGSIYWVCALPEPWSLLGSATAVVTLGGLIIAARRTVPVQAHGFSQPRTLWMPALMIAVMIGAFLIVDAVPEPPGIQWQWIIAGIAMTPIGVVLWWGYETVFRRAQLRQR